MGTFFVCVLSFCPTAAGEDVGLRRVDSDAADVVRVSLKHVNSLQSVVVEHTDQHIILGTDNEIGKCTRPGRKTQNYADLSGHGHCLQRGAARGRKTTGPPYIHWYYWSYLLLRR